jgi:hypothetical protein
MKTRIVTLAVTAILCQLVPLGAQVTEGGKVNMKIVGGRVFNNKPMMVISAPKFQLKPTEIDASIWALTEKLSPENDSFGVVTNYSSDVVEFENALFLSPAPQEIASGTGELPFPMFLSLSPSAHAVWKGEVPLAVSRDGIWTVSSIAPDVFIRCKTNQDGKVVLRVQSLFVATKKNELAIESAIRFEQISFANAIAFQANGTQFTIQRTVFAFQGKQAAGLHQARISVDASLAKGQQWYVESGSSKQYLTDFKLAADGQCSAVYANGLTIPMNAGDGLRKDVATADENAGQHFTEAIRSAHKEAVTKPSGAN